MAATDEKAAGKAKLQCLECPRCDCRHMCVVETRSTPKRIVRIRQCRHGGRRVITCEAIGVWRVPGVADCSGQPRGQSSAFERPDSGG